MWPFSRKNVGRTEGALKKIEVADHHLKEAQEKELLFTNNALQKVADVINDLIHCEHDVQRLIADGEKGAISQDEAEELTEGLTRIYHRQQETLGSLSVLVDACELALESEAIIKKTLKSEDLTRFEEKDFILFTKDEERLLKNAKRMLDDLSVVMKVVKDLHTIDIELFKKDPAGEARHLRTKISVISTHLVKTHETIAIIGQAASDSIRRIDILRQDITYLEKAFDHALAILRHGPAQSVTLADEHRTIIEELKKQGKWS